MRIRIRYRKEMPLRFTSALDIQKIWERSLRRSGFSIAYSQGFHPQPKIQLGLPLPLGFISDEEHVDVWIECDDDIQILKEKITPNLPFGLVIDSIDNIALHQKPLVTIITKSEYLVKFWDAEFDKDNLSSEIDNFLERKEILRKKRNNKEYDLRSLVYELELLPFEKSQEDFILSMTLSSAQNKMGRADEVMAALGFSLDQFLIKRSRSY